MCYFNLDFYKFLELLWEFEFCGKASVLTMSSQDKFKRKGQRKRLLWLFFGGWMTTIFKMAAWMYRLWMKTFFFSDSFFFFKGHELLEMRQVLYFICKFSLDWRFTTSFTLKLSAVIPAPTGTVYMLLGDEWRQPEERRQFDCHKLFSRRVLKARRFW